jgi:hypothetical protein
MDAPSKSSTHHTQPRDTAAANLPPPSQAQQGPTPAQRASDPRALDRLASDLLASDLLASDPRATPEALVPQARTQARRAWEALAMV